MANDDLISRQAVMKEFADFVRQSNNSDFARTPTWNDAVSLVGSTPSAQRWIPCDTYEPDLIGDYLLYRPHFWGANKGQVTVCYWDGHDWSDNYKNDAERYLPVIPGMAWMPLPKPWEGEDDDSTLP